MSTTIQLPAMFDLQALYRFTRGIVGPDGNPLDSDFTFDFDRMNFMDGTGYTVFSNTLGWLLSKEVVCRFRNFRKLERPGIAYLDDCGFFQKYRGRPLSPLAACRRTTLPCTAIEHAQAHGWLDQRFSAWLCGVLDVSHGGVASIRTCIKELFNNINDHSTLNTGFVHAQHYPNNKQVRVTVSDFGRGIPSTIRERFGDMHDDAAILHASMEGVTAQSQPNNMGAGLSFLIDRITGCHGKVRIHSLSGNLYCFRDNGATVKRRSLGNGSYPGTLIEISLDTRLFVADEEERVDIEW